MSETIATDDIWSPLGEQRWRELAEGTGASELQIRFAAARFGGATATRAASLSGYAGDKDAIRRAGYAALRTTAVQNLLELAAINAPSDAKISDKEIDAKLARLIRSGDPNVVIKAAELHAKREAAKAEAGNTPDDDALNEWRLCRDFLIQPQGATQFVLFYRAMKGPMGHPANYPLLLDVQQVIQGEQFGKAVWDWVVADMSEAVRDLLYERLSNPDHQLEMRKKVWAEVGVKLSDRGQFGMGAVSAA
jgi:hypothetical protein